MKYSYFTVLVVGHTCVNIVIIASYYFPAINWITFLSNYIGDYFIILSFLIIEFIFFVLMSYLLTVKLLKNFTSYINIDSTICLINLLTSYLIIIIIASFIFGGF